MNGEVASMGRKQRQAVEIENIYIFEIKCF